jgi:hypothetical protein
MSRQFVHLSSDPNVALQVGSRHGKSIVIEVNADSLYNDTHLFYNTRDNVWLTKDIPNTYLDFGQWRTLIVDEMLFLGKELINEVGAKHRLYNRLNTLKAIMKRDDLDDCLFIDTADNTIHIVHLTWNNQNYYSDIYPNTRTYINMAEWLTTDFLKDYNLQ